MTARGPRGARFFLRARRSNAPVFRTDAIHSKTPGLRVARSMRAAGTCSSILFWRDYSYPSDDSIRAASAPTGAASAATIFTGFTRANRFARDRPKATIGRSIVIRKT